jgi:hypothetical protein
MGKETHGTWQQNRAKRHARTRERTAWKGTCNLLDNQLGPKLQLLLLLARYNTFSLQEVSRSCRCKSFVAFVQFFLCTHLSSQHCHIKDMPGWIMLLCTLLLIIGSELMLIIKIDCAHLSSQHCHIKRFNQLMLPNLQQHTQHKSQLFCGVVAWFWGQNTAMAAFSDICRCAGSHEQHKQQF